LTASEGEAIWEIMQRIRRHPLLESIYRQIAMPLMDQMIAASRARQAESAAAPRAR
jgi:hypothetical protein